MNPGHPVSTVRRILALRDSGATYEEILRTIPGVSYSTIVRLCQGKSRPALVTQIRNETVVPKTG